MQQKIKSSKKTCTCFTHFLHTKRTLPLHLPHTHNVGHQRKGKLLGQDVIGTASWLEMWWPSYRANHIPKIFTSAHTHSTQLHSPTHKLLLFNSNSAHQLLCPVHCLITMCTYLSDSLAYAIILNPLLYHNNHTIAHNCTNDNFFYVTSVFCHKCIHYHLIVIYNSKNALWIGLDWIEFFLLRTWIYECIMLASQRSVILQSSSG